MAAAQPLPGLPAGDETATDDAPAVVAEVTVTTVAVELPDLETRKQWYEEWEEKTAKAQELARRDRAYYDNDQWTEEEIAELERRHQPVITKNRIARKVNFILGEEIRKRVDPCARPRTPQHEDAAQAATDALRYVADEQLFDACRSEVLKNIVIEGYGGALKSVEQEDKGDYRHVLKHVEWDRLFYDPHSRAPDFSDGMFRGIIVWMDLADAVLEYPQAAEALKQAVDRSPDTTTTTEDTPRAKCWGDRKRQRVKLVEMFFRVDRDWHRCVFTDGADIEEPERTWLLDEKRRHSVCPLVMMSCYVDQDGMRYGVVRQLISSQDEINKRASKALHLLSVNGVIAEDNAISDPTKFQIELAKPDGFATGVRPGALESGAVQVRDGQQLAQGQFQLLQEAKNDIDSIGPSSATVPDLPASASGRAVLARAQAASQELGTIFDQLRTWSHAVYVLDWLCIRLYWTDEKWLRVTDDQELNGYRFTTLNQRMTREQRFRELLKRQPPVEPKQALGIAAGDLAGIVEAQVGAQVQQMQREVQMAAQQAQAMGVPPPHTPPAEQAVLELIASHPAMAEEITVNQVDQLLVDIVLDDSPDSTILADEQFEILGQLAQPIMSAAPQALMTWAKMLIRASKLPNKRELLRDLEKEPDPAQAQAQQQIQQLQSALMQANVAVSETRAQLQQAQTAKTAAEAEAIGPKTMAEVQQKQAQTAHAAAQAQAVPGKLQLEAQRDSVNAEHTRARAMHVAATAGEKAAMVPMQGGIMPRRGMMP